MVAYKTVMPGSTPGTITRWNPPPLLEPIALDGTIPPTAYGVPIKLSSGAAAKLETGDSVASVIAGFLARPYPGSPNATNEGLGTDTPNGNYAQNRFLRGYMAVTCLGSTAPAKDAQVYVRVRDNGSTSRAVGTIEAAAGTYVATAGALVGTGDGTCTMASPSTAAGVIPGVYKAVFVEAATNSGIFDVFDPNGVVVGRGVVGTAFTTQVKFTIADGATDFAAGSYFPITAVADCEAVPNAFFTGARDASNLTEIRYN